MFIYLIVVVSCSIKVYSNIFYCVFYRYLAFGCYDMYIFSVCVFDLIEYYCILNSCAMCLINMLLLYHNPFPNVRSKRYIYSILIYRLCFD